MEIILLLFIIFLFVIGIIVKKSVEEIRSVKTYNVYRKLPNNIIVVKVGWSWPASIFQWFWAFYRKLWGWGLGWLIFDFVTFPLTIGVIL